MDELDLDFKLLRGGLELKSRIARENYYRCIHNKVWVQFVNDLDATNLFLGRLAKRYSIVTKSDLYAAQPGGWGKFYTDDEETAEGFYWKNGALVLVGDDRYECFIHLQDARKWKLVDDGK